MSSIQAILFDFGKVLSLAPNGNAWERMRELTGLTEQALQDAYWAHRDAYDEGLLTGDRYWQGMVPQTLSAETLRDLKGADVALWTDMNQPMLDWVHALHAAGFRTGILSNMPDAMAEGLCERFDWLANFDHTIWSHALKLRKPQRAIYEAAIAGLGVHAEAILFIDDKDENTEAAEAAGMQAIVYRGHGEFITEMTARGYGALLHPAPGAVAAL